MPMILLIAMFDKIRNPFLPLLKVMEEKESGFITCNQLSQY